MSSSTSQRLDLVQRESEVRRQEVSEMHRRIAKKIDDEKKILNLEQSKSATVRTQLLALRHRLQPKEFMAALQLARGEAKQVADKDKRMKVLEEHGKKLSRQLSFITKKIELIGAKQSRFKAERELIQTERAAEAMGEVAAFKRFKANEREEEISQKEFSVEPLEFAEREKIAASDPLDVRHLHRDSLEDPHVTVGDCLGSGRHNHSEQQSSSEGGRQEAYDSVPRGGDAEAALPFASVLEESQLFEAAAEHWSEGAEHHLSFTVELSGERRVRIAIERRRKDSLDLVLFVKRSDAASLTEMKRLLSGRLLSSGYALEGLRVVYVGDDQ
ncbi:MAG: hypothetical protein KDD70_11535 [Bdellovibrionales bacterium]|nr:hypothetical protein [Bdellovibrionales bacterium]